MGDKFLNGAGLGALRTWILQKLGFKQDTLVSGTNIKTINSQSILGSGDLSVGGGLQNLVDGSATGSVRGVNTAAEGSSYTMGQNAFAEGYNTKAGGSSAHAEGSGAKASAPYSHAEGRETTASGSCSHVEGFGAEASGDWSHAEGRDTMASGDYSHAEGIGAEASGDYSHAEGRDTMASGDWSHAEGWETTASRDASHAEGYDTTASGDYSHAQNLGTIASKSAQTAIGKYNIEDTEATEANQKALIIGNGDGDSSRSNALTVDWQGNVDIASGASYKINGTPLSASDVNAQPVLVSGVNIKTVNNESILGGGNIDTTPSIATDAITGTIKLNSSESITLNSDGQLDVGGRLGQMSNTTGIYSPKTINPKSIGNGSFLLTEASGLTLGSKSLGVVTGNGITLKTAAAAGATQYTVANTYETLIYCAGLKGATVAKDEASSATTYVTVTNVTSNGYAPANANYWKSTSDIIITTDDSINPDSSISSIRVYYPSTGFSNLTVGQQVGHSGGASVAVGQRVFGNSGNACALVGASIYNTGHGNAVFGRQHISKKNRSFLAGTGHDTTNGPSEGVAALGQWSDIKSNTSFAIGNGTSATARSNSFEINTAGDALFDGYIVLKSPNGTQYRVSVNNSGQLITAQI